MKKKIKIFPVKPTTPRPLSPTAGFPKIDLEKVPISKEEPVMNKGEKTIINLKPAEAINENQINIQLNQDTQNKINYKYLTINQNDNQSVTPKICIDPKTNLLFSKIETRKPI